jgi:hypothetical protein
MQQQTPYRWDSPAIWFGVTLGASVWMAITASVLAGRGSGQEGAIIAACYLLQAALAVALWNYRGRISAYAAWQSWFAMLWVVSLVAVATLHWTGTYPKANLNEWGVVLMWVGVAIGGPLLMLDTWARHRSNGTRNLFGSLFDLIAGFF